MLARTLQKLLDESIVPAVIVIAGKIIGLFLANTINSLSYSLQAGGGILPWSVVYSTSTEAQTANTFSNFIMYLVVLVGFLIVLFRAHFLHASHIPPRLAGRLAKMKLENFVQTTFEIYHQALVWLSFLWITTILVFIYTLGGGSIMLMLTSFLLSFAATYLYTKDIEVELETERTILERR
ncbi:MAG TPA: hypothetical protein VFK94_01430 [Patescibacteria group bacterium]|nr:hypothetical protein [Patescibacteria group bacterium]